MLDALALRYKWTATTESGAESEAGRAGRNSLMLRAGDAIGVIGKPIISTNVGTDAILHQIA